MIEKARKKTVTKPVYLTLDKIEEEYFLEHPEEIDSYLAITFEDYAKDGCTSALMADLRVIARVKGVSAAAAETNTPYFENINAMMVAMGYYLAPVPFLKEELQQ